MAGSDRSDFRSVDDDGFLVREEQSGATASIGTLRLLGSDPRHDPPQWIVIDKPAGLHSVASARGDGGRSVEETLRSASEVLRDLEQGGLVHRLDRETSGAMLVATSMAARGRLRDAISDGSIGKVYLAAISSSTSLPASGTFRLRFSSRYRRSAKVSVREDGEGQEGVCRWRTLERGDVQRLLEIELVGPGRRHQIRAGFAHLGAPLRGDPLYGGDAAARLALHATRLVVDGMAIESPRPDGFGS